MGGQAGQAGQAGTLKPCTHQTGQLSYSVACSASCAVSCRDQLGRQVVGCISQEGIACVETCEVCP